MGFAPTWLRQVSPLLHMTTLTTGGGDGRHSSNNSSSSSSSSSSSISIVSSARWMLNSITMWMISGNSGFQLHYCYITECQSARNTSLIWNQKYGHHAHWVSDFGRVGIELGHRSMTPTFRLAASVS